MDDSDPLSEPESVLPPAPAAKVGSGSLIVGALVVGMGGASLIAICGYGAMEGLKLLTGADVVVATRDIQPGETLDRENVALAMIPTPALPRTSESLADMIGRVAITEIIAGAPIRAERLGVPGRGAKASLIPKGKRALWLAVDNGAAGLGLEPGDHIDVWASFSTPMGAIQTESVAELLQIVSIEPGTRRKAARATVAATPEQLAEVTKYRTKATLLIVLRADLDFEVEASDVVVGPSSEAETPLEVHAAHDLLPGVPIAAADLILRSGSGLGVDGFASPDELVGAVPHGFILAGERLIPRNMADPTVGRGASALLAPGEAAISIGVGDNLDLFEIGTHIAIQSAPPDVEPETLIEVVPILGHHKEGLGCPCIQLVINADMAGKVVHAKAMNRLALTLPE